MNKGIRIFMAAFLIAAVVPSGAQTITKLESGWKFAFGNASGPGKDLFRISAPRRSVLQVPLTALPGLKRVEVK